MATAELAEVVNDTAPKVTVNMYMYEQYITIGRVLIASIYVCINCEL